ncbi:hypothetical protein ABIA35_005928 [Catenulispora sp. MAP12-49]|uniref:lectin n=1 Tax=unclassified Catenulispora TaxID=414885 RepID=UPI003516D968
MRIASAQRRAGVAFAVAAVALLAAAAPASADTGGKIQPGTPAVTAGPASAADSVLCVSTSGKATFVWQSDGNLVDYDETGVARWASNTAGRGASYVPLQTDGNSVIYDAAGNPIWTSDTAGHPNDYLICQDDGNVVITDGSTPLWATMTQH